MNVGDQVIVHTSFGNKRVGTVARTTQTQIIVDGVRFGRKSHRMIGFKGSGFACPRICTPQEGEVDKVNDYNERMRIVGRLQKYNWKALPLANLQAIEQHLM